MDNNQGTLRARRKQKVKFSDEEVITILRAFIAHPTSWADVIDDVKGNIDRLQASAHQLYATATNKQQRDRMSSKLSSLIAINQDSIQNVQIRDLLQSIRDTERRLVADPIPPLHQPAAAPAAPAQAPPADQAPVPEPAVPARAQVDMRDGIVAGMPPSSSDTEGAAADPQPPARGERRRRRKRKRSLADLVRENQVIYRRWMKKKLPKIQRELGISSSFSSSSDDE
ncbi:uncharacterized protein LOC123541546 [Mercenaria mercenaria]|uniref:uncharacterized protein LOC123541546 n=1 Tax=Mercenaria mercenaria TaxID=6596 RepID=UPI00234E97D2|nr:uncharacterized protein LOC123541546 [Mercenaria mercenaria]